MGPDNRTLLLHMAQKVALEAAPRVTFRKLAGVPDRRLTPIPRLLWVPPLR